MPRTIKLRLRCYSQTIDSQIYTNTVRSWIYLWGRKSKNYIKKPIAFTIDKIQRAIFSVDELLVKFTEIQNYLNSTFKSAEASNFIDKINSAGFFIVTNGAEFYSRLRNFLPFLSLLMKRLQDFASLLSSLDKNIGRKFSFFSQGIVSSVMNLSHTYSFIIPTIVNTRIESISKFFGGPEQKTMLFFRRLYFDAYCSVHREDYSEFLTFCQAKI